MDRIEPILAQVWNRMGGQRHLAVASPPRGRYTAEGFRESTSAGVCKGVTTPEPAICENRASGRYRFETGDASRRGQGSSTVKSAHAFSLQDGEQDER